MPKSTKMSRILLEIKKIINNKNTPCSILNEIYYSSISKKIDSQYRIWDGNTAWNAPTLDEAFTKFKESRGITS